MRNLSPFTVGPDFKLGNSLSGAVKLSKNATPGKYILAMVLDLMRVEVFCCLMAVGLVKTL